MDLKNFWQIITARWLLILTVFAVTVGSAGIFTLQEPKRYIAWTSIVMDFKTDNPFEQSGLPAQLSSSYMATQLDIIQSKKVALTTMDILQRQFPEEFGPWNDELSRQQAATLLLQSLEVEPARESRVVEIGLRSQSPRRAQRMANAFAEAYIQTTLELTVEPARRNAEWFDEQLISLRERLQVAEAKLTDYQQEKGIIALDERLDNETARLNELSKGLVNAQSETYSVQARQLGVNHPDYLGAIERERSLLRSLDRQKLRVLELNKQRDSLELLAREVASERQNYEATLQSYYSARLESNFNRTNVSVLTPAAIPIDPVSPNVLLNMFSAIFLGLLLGVTLALLLEASNRKIRSARELKSDFDLEVLATI